MRLINESRFSDRLIHRVVRAVQVPRRHAGEVIRLPRLVTVRHGTDPFRGEAIADLEQIEAVIGRRFPRCRPRMGVYVPLRVATAEEALVYVLAHEIRHLWQWWNPELPRLRGRGLLSEADAEAYAVACLDRYR